VTNPRRAWGRRNHRAGLAAEETVARHYAARGGEVLERRWRCPEGEIDLIVQMPDALAFVEVKSGRAALTRDCITAAQWSRLEATALRYMVAAETGQATVRFDAAFVGPDGAVEIVENARTSEAW
jgi:putative endonuclease